MVDFARFVTLFGSHVLWCAQHGVARQFFLVGRAEC